MTKSKEKLQFNVFICCGKDFDKTGIYQHLAEDHNITPPIGGMRQIVQHLDATRWYENHFTWKIGEITFSQIVRNPRK